MKQAEKELDTVIGKTLRTRRVMSGLSQDQLGNAVGVTFQQVQKYEKAMNRISISRAIIMCNVMQISFLDFVRAFSDEKQIEGTTKKILAVIREFKKMNVERQNNLLELMKSMNHE